ncbi:MAG: ABC transporter ATP-binding protein [Candidatus Bathyarchaeia archaeon]
MSLDIKKGEFAVVTGPSGCGKTTLTRIINGLIPHFYEGKLTGEVYLNGQKAVKLQPWEFGKLVGSVFQDPESQFFAIAVQDEIAFSCENYGVPSKEIALRLTKAAGALHIEHLMLRQLTGLSSGEKQRVAVASVATMQPTIYVMDEPSANLDMKATEELALILKALKENGATVVLAEHRLYYIMDLADRIIYMKDGRIQSEFTPHQMKALTEHQLSEMGLRATGLEWRKHSNLTSNTASSQKPVVSVRDLCLKVGKRRDYLLANMSFNLLPGEIAALTGSNGVGKTTLARVLCGLAREAKGQILFDGRSIKHSARYKYAWFVMQDTDCQLFSESVLGEMTVGRKTTPELQRKAEEILTELNLWEYRDRHPASLSGGQKQRLTLAVAFMQDTPLLVLDEPTSGLDGANLEKLVQCIKKQAEQGRAVLVITHDHELVQSTCSKMLYLAKGTLMNDFSLCSDSATLALDCMMTEAC